MQHKRWTWELVSPACVAKMLAQILATRCGPVSSVRWSWLFTTMWKRPVEHHVLRSLKVLLFNHVAYIVKNLISDLKSFLYQEHGTWFSSRLCFVSRISSEQASLTWQPFLWWNPTTTMCSTGTRFSSLPWGSMSAGPCGLWALDSEIPGRTESSCSVSKQNRGAGSKQSAVNPARSVHVLKEQRKTQEKTRNQCHALPVTTALRWRSFRFAINNSFELWRDCWNVLEVFSGVYG